MVVTRLQSRKEEHRQLRTRQAVALVEYFESGEESENGRDPCWRLVLHPRHIQTIPQCLRDIAEQSVQLHYIFNWETGEDGCYGWQWLNVVACICHDLQINFTYNSCLGRGERKHRFGCAAYAALHEYVQNH